MTWGPLRGSPITCRPAEHELLLGGRPSPSAVKLTPPKNHPHEVVGSSVKLGLVRVEVKGRKATRGMLYLTAIEVRIFAVTGI
jgi:hypothetical protein